MVWTLRTCYLLITLRIFLLCVMTADFSSCALTNNCKQILLIDGGFCGEINTRICNESNSTCCENIYYGKKIPFNHSPPFNGSTCILSFDAKTNQTCSFSDNGVWLLYNTSGDIYRVIITRDENLRPAIPIYFIRGTQKSNWTLGTPAPQCGNVTCMDPSTICSKATYEPNCSTNDSNHDIIILKEPPECSKCGNAFKATEGFVEINSIFHPHNNDCNLSFSEQMKNVTDYIMQAMGNKSSVSVSMGNISGILVKTVSQQKFSPIHFTYSSKTEFNIIEDTSQLSTFNKDNQSSRLLNNEVYSIDMGAEISNLTNTFNLTFRSIDLNAGEPFCYSWNGQGATPNWNTDGCNTSYINGSLTCACQHLTFFAVLMIPTKKISDTDLNYLTYITSIGCGLSIFFLSIGLFMHFLLRKGQASISVHILMNLFLALLLLNLSFLVNEPVANTGNVISCKLIAGVMHYSMLSTFTWFGLQVLHLCLQLGKNVDNIQHYVTKLCITGWVPPVPVVTVIFIFQKYNMDYIVTDKGRNVTMCWIIDPTVHYVVNIGYYAVIFIFTFLAFVVMLRWLCLLRIKFPTIPMSGKKSRPWDVLTIIGLSCIMGLSWGFAFFAYGLMQIPALYIFTVLNSFQGFVLFIYYYKSNQVNQPGEDETSTKNSSMATSMVVENPYGKNDVSKNSG